MQKFNWSAVVGCLILAVAIIIASQGVMNAIGSIPTSSVPGSFEIYNHDDKITDGDFLRDYEAAAYLKVEQETLLKWVQVGKLKGAYTQIEIADGTEYIFSKAKLIEYMNNLINSEN